jgi:hypothetical protein
VPSGYRLIKRKGRWAYRPLNRWDHWWTDSIIPPLEAVAFLLTILFILAVVLSVVSGIAAYTR